MKEGITEKNMLDQVNEISGMGFHLDMVLRKIQGLYLHKFAELGVDMTIEQWVILHQVYELGESASQREITKLNFRNRATTSRIIGKLEGKGWIQKTRFEGDLKQFKLELSSDGLAIINKVKPHAIDLRRLAVADISVSDFQLFLDVLEKIGENYDGDIK